MIGRSSVFYGLLAVLVLAPLPLAANRPWSWSLLCLAVATLTGLWVISTVRRRDGIAVSLRHVAVPAALFVLVCSFAVLQALPGVPADFTSSFWSILPAASEGPPLTVSAAPYATMTALMRLIAYGCVFWLALQSFRSRHKARRAVIVLAIATSAYSAYGLVVQFSGWETILWYDKWAYEDDLTSTFVNRNSFATFAGLGLLCALVAFSLAVTAVTPPGVGEAGQVRNAITVVSGLGLTGFALLACVLINASALFLTSSRAGIASTILAVLVLILGVALRRRSSRWLVWGLPALAVVSVAGLFELSGQRLANRLDWFIASGGFAGQERVVVYRETIRAIGDNLILGTGYGTYPDVFKSYRGVEIGGYFDKAHNSYLELALELGPVAAALLVLAMALLALRCMTGILRRSGSYLYAWLGFCASVLVGIHALVDFSLQMPAVAALYAALLGLGCAQSWSSQVETGDGGAARMRFRA